jgi:hypothetical protein
LHTVIRDPDDDTDTKRLFGTPKNNLGRTNLPTLRFMDRAHRLGREHDGSIADALRQSQDNGYDRSATQEASDWLEDHLTSRGGSDDCGNIKREGSKAGHSESTLKRAKKKLNLRSHTSGYPRTSLWSLPTQPPADGHSDQP